LQILLLEIFSPRDILGKTDKIINSRTIDVLAYFNGYCSDKAKLVSEFFHLNIRFANSLSVSR